MQQRSCEDPGPRREEGDDGDENDGDKEEESDHDYDNDYYDGEEKRLASNQAPIESQTSWQQPITEHDSSIQRKKAVFPIVVGYALQASGMELKKNNWGW